MKPGRTSGLFFGNIVAAGSGYRPHSSESTVPGALARL